MSEQKTKTNADMREALRKQREKDLKKDRNKKIILFSLIAIVALALISGAVWALTQSSSNQTETALGEQLTPTKIDSTGAFHVTADGVVEDTTPTGQTRVDMFFDPMCPGCGIVDRGMNEELQTLVDNGEVDLFMTPVAFLDDASSDDYSSRAVNATIVIAEEAPEYYLDFISDLYEAGNQPSEGSAYVSVTDEMLAERAIELGVPEDVANKFSEGNYIEWIKEHSATQLNDRSDLFPDGFSTPAVFLNLKYNDAGEAVDYTRVNFDNAEIYETFDTALKAAKSEE